MSRRIPLPPYPTGWFCIAFTSELRRRPRVVRWVGRHLRVRRDGDRIVVHAADGGAEPVIKVQQGAVFGWFDADGRAPLFDLPCPDPTGWTAYVGHTWSRLNTHPQETTENAVDVAHFSLVHGYTDVQTVRPATVDGPVLRARYSFTRANTLFGFALTAFRSTFDVEVFGLGYSYVENRVPALGLHTRQMVYATPLDEDHMALRIAGAIRVGRLGRAIAWLTRNVMMTGYALDVSRDLEIWQTKRYLERPRIVSGDGPIGRYRVWCRQFYPAEAT